MPASKPSWRLRFPPSDECQPHFGDFFATIKEVADASEAAARRRDDLFIALVRAAWAGKLGDPLLCKQHTDSYPQRMSRALLLRVMQPGMVRSRSTANLTIEELEAMEDLSQYHPAYVQGFLCGISLSYQDFQQDSFRKDLEEYVGAVSTDEKPSHLRSKHDLNADLIVSKLEEFGFDPLRVPRGGKAKCQKALESERRLSKDSFEHAWKRTDRVRSAIKEKSTPKR